VGGLPIALVIVLPVLAVVVVLFALVLLGVAISGILLKQTRKRADLQPQVTDGITTPTTAALPAWGTPPEGSESTSVVEMRKVSRSHLSSGGVRGVSAAGRSGGGHLDVAGSVTGLATTGARSDGRAIGLVDAGRDGEGGGNGAATHSGRGGDTHLGGGGVKPEGYTLDSFQAAEDIDATPTPGENSVFNADGPVFTVTVAESLPSGWEKHLDDNGDAYFANDETGETSWERPTSSAT
jgi:hypothetical protein